MGIVYEAEQASLGRRVALKILPRSAARDARQLARFQVKAHAVGTLSHPNIVPIFAVGSDRGVPYYAMQFIDGRSLAQLIRERREQAELALPDTRTLGFGRSPGSEFKRPMRLATPMRWGSCIATSSRPTCSSTTGITSGLSTSACAHPH